MEGSESPETIELLFRALKWLMQYEHTNAEELKEIAEKEAIELAEKEENWEQEKEILKVFFIFLQYPKCCKTCLNIYFCRKN